MAKWIVNPAETKLLSLPKGVVPCGDEVDEELLSEVQHASGVSLFEYLQIENLIIEDDAELEEPSPSEPPEDPRIFENGDEDE